MTERPFSILPARPWDLWALTRMTLDNMQGVDRELTKLISSPLMHAFSYLLLPVYLGTAGRGFKAVSEGRIVGCAYLHVRQLGGLVFNVNVNREVRRQGVGRALMERMEQEIRKAGRCWLGLQVDSDNQPATNLYLNLGYRFYNPYFLRTRTRSVLRRERQPAVTVRRLPRREGYRLFKHYANVEREMGDGWAAAVVKADFNDGPPSGGAFYQCRLESWEVGCVWLGGTENLPKVALMLQPDVWHDQTTTAALLHILLDHHAPYFSRADVRLGSSAHYHAALDILQPFGFEPQEEEKHLMLKEVQGGERLEIG
jgi:GNAT superfamily N-acetyltransferase